MKQIIVEREYQPSSAILQLGDPIYRGSMDAEQIHVGAVSILPFILLGGLALLIFWRKK